MKTIFCFSVFLLWILSDICSTVATNNGAEMTQEDKEGNCSKRPKYERPVDCAEVRANGITKNGVYTVFPRSRLAICKSIDVYCDMETLGGGWTVIQRRGQYGNAENYFVKKWKEYKEGFGNLEKEFWLGNDNIYSIANQGQYSVRFDMTHENGTSAFSLYENFWIENEEAKYKLHLSEYSGTAGNAIENHSGMDFYTVDHPNKLKHGDQPRSGGWWLNILHSSSLNGLNLYKSGKESFDGITWWSFGAVTDSLQATEIKVRPKKFH